MSGTMDIGIVATVESASYEVITLPPLEEEPTPTPDDQTANTTKITEIKNKKDLV